jgi:hypothetical protein
MSDVEFVSLRKLAEETDRAYEAFLEYVALGADRSLMRLEANRQSNVKPATLRTLQEWSAKHRWQERLADYLLELAQAQAKVQKERMLKANTDAWKRHQRILERLDAMIDKFENDKVTRRRRVPDPRNEGQEIEVVTLAPNVLDLRRLAETFSKLQDNMLELGGGTPNRVSVDLPAGGAGVKAYITISPDHWPDPGETPSPEADDEPDPPQPV